MQIFSPGNGYCIHILNSKFYVNVLSTKLSTAVTFAFILELFTIHYMAHIKYTQFLPCKIPQISVGTLKTDITTTKSSKYLTFLKILKNPNALNSISRNTCIYFQLFLQSKSGVTFFSKQFGIFISFFLANNDIKPAAAIKIYFFFSVKR